MYDGLVLVGLSGSGKTTVGRLIAERQARPFVDTDELIARHVGEPAASYLRRAGEPAFREAESRAVAEAVRDPRAVVSVGGGATTDPVNRWTLWQHGTVAWLRAPDEVLLARLARDLEPRPMLDGEPARALSGQGEQRAPFLRAADITIEAAGPPDGVVAAILAREAHGFNARRLFDAEVPRQHPLGPEHARVVMGVDLDGAAFSDALDAVDHPGPSIVIDRAVAGRLPALLETLRAARPGGRCRGIRGGERTKRFGPLEDLLEWLATERAERSSPLIVVGGGTVGDLAGTAAAIYARGVPLVHVPTTWLAQADSAIGGKVAIDLPRAKNAIGAFWPPVAVIADIGLLRTQTIARRRDGMAESLKAGMIGDPALWRLIERRGKAALRNDQAARYAIVERAVRVKLAVCERDPFEAGERRILNLGHTVGHALEIESGYRLAHGIAVALGMRAVAAVAAGRGADPDLAAAFDEMLVTLGFPLRRMFNRDAVVTAIRGDKKRSRGRQRWILPMALGEVREADDVTDREVQRALDTIAAEPVP